MRDDADIMGSSDDEHPAPELLSGYHLRELPDDVAASVEAHLLECRDCAALLLDFRDLMDVRESESSSLADWQEPPSSTTGSDALGGQVIGQRSIAQAVLPLAALVAVVLGVGLFMSQLIDSPSAIPEFELQPSNRGATTSVVMNPNSGAAKLRAPVLVSGPYEVRLFASDGRMMRVDYRVARQEQDHVELTIGRLAGGTYRIVISKAQSSGGGIETTLGEYTFRVADDASKR